jgi:hypothetical protein
MKRLISSFVLAFAFVVASSSSAFAEHFWQVQMFQPTGAINSNAFPIEYKVFSVEQNDEFNVNLFQNDVMIATQHTTKNFGDSGVFNVAVPGPGTYKYHVSATSSIDGEEAPKSTEDKTLTVTPAPSGGVTTVFVNQATNNNPTGQGGGTGAGGAAGGDVAGATSGETNAEGQSSTNNNGDVLGAEKKNDNNKNSDNWQWWGGGIATLLVALGAGYYYMQRTGKNPFTRGSDD